MKKLSLYDLDLKGKRVLMRVDFNVPLTPDGRVADGTRIINALPSIQYILSQGASLVLMSHLGRPKGKRDEKYSLKPCAEFLAKHLDKPVAFADDCIGEEAVKKAKNLGEGEVLLLENLRFHPAEEEPDVQNHFAEQLSTLGDLYVNDAFGTAHRAHSSTTIIASFFPGNAATGFLMEKEVSFLSSLIQNPKRPFYAIIGGAKISSKLGVLDSILDKVDGIFIGGGMVFTFLKANGHEIGASICDDSFLDTAKSFIAKCNEKAIRFFLPKDILIASGVAEGAETRTVTIKEGVPEGWSGVDIGPKTVEEWQGLLTNAATIFWNGPMGVFEIDAFASGTNSLAQILADLPSVTIVGGGDSIAAINKLELSKNFTHISTGGGAALEYIEHGHLPGIDALTDR